MQFGTFLKRHRWLALLSLAVGFWMFTTPAYAPPILIAVAASWVFSAIATSAGALSLVATLGATGATIVGALAATAVSYLGQMLLGPKLGNDKRKQTVRQSLATWKFIYGCARVGGVVTLIQVSDSNDWLRGVVTLAPHPSKSVDTIYFGETEVTLTPAASGGYSYGAPNYDLPDGTKVKPDFHQNSTQTPKITIGLGTIPGDAGFNTFMASKAPDQWTSDCRQYRCTKIGFELNWSANKYGSIGIPQISAIMRGRMVLDARDTPLTISGSSTGTPGVLNTSIPHGLNPGDPVFIVNYEGATPDISGEYEVNTTPTGSSFTLLGHDSQPLAITVTGTGGTVYEGKWTDNAALCANDYLCNRLGPNCDFGTEIPQTQLVTAANICDEMVTRATQQTTFTADPATDLITYALGNTAGDIPHLAEVTVSSSGTLPTGLTAGTVYYYAQNQSAPGPSGFLCTTLNNAKHWNGINFTTAGTGTLTITIVSTFTVFTSTESWQPFDPFGGPGPLSYANSLLLFTRGLRITTGTVVRVSSSGVLPAPLSAGTDYYAILKTDQRIALSTSLANCRAGIEISITDDGTGTHSVTVSKEPRYMTDGLIDTAGTIQDNLRSFADAMGGYIVPAGVAIGIYPGAYLTPTVTIDDGDFRREIQVTALQSSQQAFNSTRGVFIDPFNAWESTDFPAYTDATYLADDNGNRIFKDFQYPLTISSTCCQRLARIGLNRSRRELIGTFPLKFTAFQISVPDTVMVDSTLWGWVGETFEVASFSFGVEDDQNGLPALVVDATVRQIDANVFAWSSNNEIGHKAQPNTTLPDPFDVQPPTNMVLASGTDQLYVRGDGTVAPRVLVTWDQPADAFVLDGGFIEMQYKKNSDSAWKTAAPVTGDQTTQFLIDVQDRELVDIALRSRNVAGGVSDTDHPWQCEMLGYLVIGKTEPPNDVPSISVGQNGTQVLITGGSITDLDAAAFEFRYNITPDWATATFIEAPNTSPSDVGFYASCTTGKVPGGTWWFGAKAKDTSGNYSDNPVWIQATITNPTVTLLTLRAQELDWLGRGAGTSTGFVLHYTGVIYPDSTVLASAMSDSELWDTFVFSPVATAYYEAFVIDLGSDTDCYVYSNPLTFGAGPGVGGVPNVTTEIDYYLSGHTDPGTWATFTAETITARYIHVRIKHVTTNPGVISVWDVEVDVGATSDQEGLITAIAGGSPVVFVTPFHSVPSINLTAEGANVAWYSSPSKTGFTAHVGPNTGADNGGNASWQARGV